MQVTIRRSPRPTFNPHCLAEKRAESLFSPIKRRLLIDRDSPLSATCDPFFLALALAATLRTLKDEDALVW